MEDMEEKGNSCLIGLLSYVLSIDGSILSFKGVHCIRDIGFWSLGCIVLFRYRIR